MASINTLVGSRTSPFSDLSTDAPAEGVAASRASAAPLLVGADCETDEPDANDAPTGTLDFADLFDHAPVGYLVLDGNGCIRKINHPGAAILGWEQSWLTGKPFSNWVTSNDKALLHAHLHTVHRGNASQDLRVKNRQGWVVNVRLHSTRESSIGNGISPGCRCIMIDVSGEQQSARKLRHLQSQLAHMTRLNTVGELASNLAHELNQPLGTVMLNCETALRLLNEDAAGEYEFAEALIQAREAASFASGVVRHLRGFLRDNDELQTVCELPGLILDVSTLIRADARDDDIELLLEIESDLPRVRVDSVQIEQVLLNLAHNGIEAMREYGGGRNRVIIKAGRDSPNRIRVSVTDTGPGMDASQLERMFAPFYTTKHDGMGIGLSISRTIIEAHGGKLWAAVEPGQGATVHFTLPIIDDKDAGLHAGE